MTVLRGKGGKRRTIGLDPGAFAVVERWLDARAKRRISGRAPLICTLHGKPVASAYVRALMPRQPPLTQLAYWTAALMLGMAAAFSAVREMGEVSRHYNRQRAELFRGSDQDGRADGGTREAGPERR